MENRIGEAIRLLRVQKGLSQQQLADQANISIGYISLIERCKRNTSLLVLRRVSEALGKPLFLIIFLAEKDTLRLSQDLKEKMLYEVMK